MKLASVSGVSYGSIKRFETTGHISLTKIAMASVNAYIDKLGEIGIERKPDISQKR